MEILGEPLFAKGTDGQLLSRIGTLFLRTPCLVTRRGVHAMQRVMWLDELNARRAAKGAPALTPEEEETELASSVDLIFTDDFVLIRPDPERMDLALEADELLQKSISKRRIRYLNTHEPKVCNALRARGENWRMARAPISQADICQRIASSRVSVGGDVFYYYNVTTGTRYLTCGAWRSIRILPAEKRREQVVEIATLLKRRNRHGRFEVDLFPASVSTPALKNEIAAVAEITDSASLDAALDSVAEHWYALLPEELQDESAANCAWRNAICCAITKGLIDTEADESDLIQGISPEFFRQIEWLPGARLDRGEVIFDSLWTEFNRTRDPELAEICDVRARNLLFNLSRLYGDLEYVNIGRLKQSLARRPSAQRRRGDVYLVQYKQATSEAPVLYVYRFQKWGIAEHLDEGKNLLQAILEANEYSDYILDRRLMCLQLGMHLSSRVTFGEFAEPYCGSTGYSGTTVRAYYYARAYLRGTASDRILSASFRSPAFAEAFARLMGEAAAIDLVVGRRSSETGENLFDGNYELFEFDEAGLPCRLIVTDHAGSFVDYLGAYETNVREYARAIRSRRAWVTDYSTFAATYAAAFERTLRTTQNKYRERRRAFDELFVNRPIDTAGSGAYRWAKTLERLDQCDPKAVADILRRELEA